jgi:hypothetical protein
MCCGQYSDLVREHLNRQSQWISACARGCSANEDNRGGMRLALVDRSGWALNLGKDFIKSLVYSNVLFANVPDGRIIDVYDAHQ